MENKKTLVLGASLNTDRASYEAVLRLKARGHEVVAVGVREGNIQGVPVVTGRPAATGVDTVTLYLNPDRQEEFYDYILGLSPQRIIFNPGTENPALARQARERGIQAEYACTLVMLSLGAY